MGKEIVAMSIDTNLMERVRQLNINISGTVNEFLQNLVAKHEGNLDGINIRLEELERDKAINKVSYWTSELKTRENRIKKYEELQAEKEKEKLEKEREKIEKQESCANCGNKETSKWHPFKIGNICNSCVFTVGKDKFDEWSKENDLKTR